MKAILKGMAFIYDGDECYEGRGSILGAAWL